MSAINLAKAMPPSVRLAHVVGAQGDNVLKGQRGVSRLPDDSRPALLISYAYLSGFLKYRAALAFRDWALDSGAFTAHSSGEPVDLAAYIAECKRLLAEPGGPAEIFSLDVIGDWKASRRNAEAMREAGVPIVPTFHYGSPWGELVALAKDFPKIALGGVAKMRDGRRIAWAAQCFARVWPKKIHGFGFGSAASLRALPFHSTDSTSWEIAACGFGNWRSFGKMSVRGSKQNLRAEVEFYLRLEREARSRWVREMALLEAS